MERLGDGEVRSDGMARHGDVESGVRLEAEEGKDSLVREAEEGGDPSRDARADGAAVAAGRPGEAVGIHDAVGTRGRGAPEPIVGRRAEERRGRLRDVQERRAGDATEEMDELFVRKILHRKIRRPRARRDRGGVSACAEVPTRNTTLTTTTDSGKIKRARVRARAPFPLVVRRGGWRTPRRRSPRGRRRDP